ncbi:MAG: hypothetical protein M1820_004336 [Bogoriella megaspora]|nr:MAG: hypothetical protein M1820_004336 [Bogoriella megaspora]
MFSILLASLIGLVSAQITKQCQNSICYSLNIPQNTASSGNGDIFFQISAPTSNTWVALGQGSGMSGSNIFVIYTNANGQNVTLSPRAGTGHVEPQFSSGPQVSLLAGSGVSNGMMTANVRCSNCNSWSGGSMDFTSSQGTWIWAVKGGSALSSDSASADISQHDQMGSFTFDFTKARGGSDVNPFTNPSATTAGSGSGACSRTSAAAVSAAATSGSSGPRPGGYGPYGGGSSGSFTSPPARAPSGGWYKRDAGGDGDGGDDCASGNEGFTGGAFPDNAFFRNMERSRNIMIAHGVMASLAFVILMPFGAIGVRLFSFPGAIWLHAAWQILSYALYIVAFGMGVWMAKNLSYLDKYHPIIGIILFILLFFQPFLGFVHHLMFKKYSRRTFWSYAHLWLGRIIITLGIINGGLGLMLADNASTGQKAAYGVVAGVIWVMYVAAVVYAEIQRSRVTATETAYPPKYADAVRTESGGQNVSPGPGGYYPPPPK